MSKNKILNDYVSFGRFYTLEYKNGKKYDCRNVLEILEINSFQNANQTIESIHLDAIIIMMNPGGGKPKCSKYQCPIVKYDNIHNLNQISLVEADPDKTQQQVMSVMKIKNWKHVRVINLSDYREPKSPIFFNFVKEAFLFDEDYIHSIFSKKRQDEFLRVFEVENNTTIITAWGVNTKLRNLIQLALQNNQIKRRIGYAKSTNVKKNNFYYYHPLPRSFDAQKRWVNEIVKKSLVNHSLS